MKILFIYFKYPFFIEGSYFQEFLNKFAEKIESVYLLATWYPKKQFKKSPNIEFFWLPLLRIRVIEELLFILFAFIKVVFTKKLHEVDCVSGLSGFKFLRRESENDIMKSDLLSPVRFRPKMFWFCVLTISQVLVYRFPKLAFELFCVKRV